LITLDSPFVPDLPESPSAQQDIGSEFEKLWNTFESTDARGWCEVSTDVVVRRLQGLALDIRVIAADRLPFEGVFRTFVHGATFRD
jgi:AP-4 complex subunit epsilon-1